MDGLKPGDDIYRVVFDSIERVQGVQNPHKVRVRKMGYKYLVDLDIEVDPDMSVKKAFSCKKVEASTKEDHKNVYDVHAPCRTLWQCRGARNFGIDSSKEFNESLNNKDKKSE